MPGEEGAAGLANMGGGIGLIIYIVFIVGVMYLLIFLPQKRRDKKAREMVEALRVGDKVTTIGGVSGKIINIKDDEITLESGIAKTKLVLKNWAVKDVDKPIEA